MNPPLVLLFGIAALFPYSALGAESGGNRWDFLMPITMHEVADVEVPETVPIRGVLYPIFGLLLSPVIAAAAMSFSSISVIDNALRLRGADV